MTRPGRHARPNRRRTSRPLSGFWLTINYRHRDNLGATALRALEVDVEAGLAWAIRMYRPEVGPFERFARARAELAEKEFFARHKARNLRFERADQDRRETAIREGEAGIAWFLQRQVEEVKRLQSAISDRKVPEPIRRRRCQPAKSSSRRSRPSGRPGRFPAPTDCVGGAASFQLASWVVDRLRTKRLISVVVTPADVNLPSSDPTPRSICSRQSASGASATWSGRLRRAFRGSSAVGWRECGTTSSCGASWACAGRRREVTAPQGRGDAGEGKIRDVLEQLGYRDLLDD